MLRHWRYGILCILLFVVGAFAGHWTANRVNADQWGSSQWGPAAAWVGALLTATAISVSLWQAFEAKSKAKRDAESAAGKLAEERGRHEREMKEANNRLEQELDLQRRFEQIRSIPPISASMTRLTLPTSDFLMSLARFNAASEERRLDGRTLQRHELEDVRITSSAWMDAFVRVETSFTTAQLVIDNEQVTRLIATLYKRLKTLHEEVAGALHRCFDDKPTDTSALSEKFDQINDFKSPIVILARRELDRGGPLIAYPDDMSIEDMMLVPPDPTVLAQIAE